MSRRRWIQLGRSDFPWEQEALDHVKSLLPDADPYRAWADFSFAARTGHVRQCDLFVITTGGLYLIEIKSHPGRVTRQGGTYVFRADRTLREENPLPLLAQKCKELRSELEQAARSLGIDPGFRMYINEALFFSAPDLSARLDEQQRVKIYGREDRDTGLPRIWSDLLGQPPADPRRRITAEQSDIVERLLDRLGIRGSRSHLRLGKWNLALQVLESSPTWEDRIATCPDLPGEQRRARVYLTEAQADEDRRRSTLRAAQREYQVLQGITHRGIAQAVDFEQHDAGPVVLFQHRDGDMRLDQYMDLFGETLTIDTRLDLVRQLAEAVQYAHRRHLYHQALAARSVYVTCRSDGSRPTIRIGDWQTAARDQDSNSPNRNFLLTTLSSSHVESAAQVYLAPEWRLGEYPDPVLLDVFGLGAISHLVLTGKPPAVSRSELIDRLTGDHGLRPFTVADGVTAAMDELVFAATRANAYDRTDSAEAFLTDLDRVEEELTAPEQEQQVDLLTAVKGQVVDGEWMVERVLGSGATAKALLVVRTVPGEPGEGDRIERRVLKVALDQDKNASLYEEAVTLREVGGGTIVRLLEEPREVAGRVVLVLEFAGERSLARWLKDEDPPTLDQIDRFSGDLLVALDHLDGKGIWHRDIKPDNLGVSRRRDRSYQLKLYDFSHSKASEKDVRAGTNHYIDPFLGTIRRPTYDGFAERYAAGVTLHELVTHGRRPIWGDGLTDPRQSSDELPYLAEEVFDPALREGLKEFFARCFHRDHGMRFSRMRDMHAAWRALMAGATTAVPLTSEPTAGAEPDNPQDARDAAAMRATLDMPLAQAGLSPRAVSAAARLNATTVGELLAVPLFQITRVRGAGNLTKRELNQRWRQWRDQLQPASGSVKAKPKPAAAEAPDAGQPHGHFEAHDTATDVDALAALLLGPTPKPLTKKFQAVRVSLGLPDAAGTYTPGVPPWPVQEQVAKAVSAHQVTVSLAWSEAVARWFTEPELARARAEIAQILAGAGRVMEARELAAELLAQRGSAAQDDDPRLAAARAAAVVHGLVEAERLRGEQPDPGDDQTPVEDQEPRFLAPRWGERILVALDSDDETMPTATDLRDYAKKLGLRADALAASDPLPGPDTVQRELRGIAPPGGTPPLSDTRLVRLAAAASKSALVSQRFELYPQDLPLVRALRIAQAGSFPGPGGLNKSLVFTRLRSRFPELELGDVGAHTLEKALHDAGYENLIYEPSADRFVSKTVRSWEYTDFTRRISGSGSRAPSDETSPSAVLRRTLADAAEHGGFRAVGVDLRYAPEAVAALVAQFGGVPVDVSAMFVAQLRSYVAEQGKPSWDKVLGADAELTETGRLPHGFSRYVAEVWRRLAPRLAEAAGPRRIALLHNAGLMARYAGGMELLADLRNAARRPDELPHGLWILCPMDAIEHRPRLDGQVVEAEAHEWIRLESAVINQLGAGGTRLVGSSA